MCLILSDAVLVVLQSQFLLLLLQIKTSEVEIGLDVVLVENQCLFIYLHQLREDANSLLRSRRARSFLSRLHLARLGCLSIVDLGILQHVLQRGPELDAVAQGVQGVNAIPMVHLCFSFCFFHFQYLPVEAFCVVVFLVFEQEDVGS